MVDKPEIKEDKNKTLTDTASGSAGKTPNEENNKKSSGSYLAESEAVQTKKKNILQELFSNGNKLLTLPGSSEIVINDETRRLIALFSD